MRVLLQGTAEADGVVVDLTRGGSPSPTQRDAGPSAAPAAASVADEHVQGARVPPAPGVPEHISCGAGWAGCRMVRAWWADAWI